MPKLISEFEIPIDAISVNKMYFTDKAGFRRLSYDARDFKNTVAQWICIKHKIPPLETYTRIEITFRFTTRAFKTRDIDNYAKSLLDSTQGLLVSNDKFYKEILLIKEEADEPSIYIKLFELDI